MVNNKNDGINNQEWWCNYKTHWSPISLHNTKPIQSFIIQFQYCIDFYCNEWSLGFANCAESFECYVFTFNFYNNREQTASWYFHWRDWGLCSDCLQAWRWLTFYWEIETQLRSGAATHNSPLSLPPSLHTPSSPSSNSHILTSDQKF